MIIHLPLVYRAIRDADDLGWKNLAEIKGLYFYPKWSFAIPKVTLKLINQDRMIFATDFHEILQTLFVERIPTALKIL